MEKTSVIQRNDYIMFTNKLTHILCFCSKCDPKAEGGYGGILLNCNIYNNDKNIQQQKQFINYCPTCGKEIDWNNITEKDNYIK